MPTVTWADARDGGFWRGGALELGLAAEWLLEALALDVLLKRYQNAPLMQKAVAVGALVNEINRLRTEGYRSLPLSTFEPLRKLGVGDHFFELVAQPNSREASAPYSVASAYDKVRVPAYNIGGWYDIFAQGTIENFVALRTKGATPQARQSRLLMGPWSHMQHTHVIGEMDFGFAAMMELINVQTDLTGLTQRWLDHWLKGIDNGITREPPIKLFIMRDNVWRDENEFPLSRAEYTRFYLHRDGVLSTQAPGDEPADHYTYDPANPTPTSGGAILMNLLFNPGVKDQRPIEAREDVLVYTSERLARDTEVTGPVVVKLRAASDARDTDFVARLVDVHPDGFAQNLTDGIIRARYRNGDTPEPLDPGKPYEYTIDLWSTANVFEAGHGIRLDIASANFPRWDRNPNTGAPFGTDAALCPARQTIFHDSEHPSHVILPIIPR
jgi:putative CocE/NonD family hydrolase